MIISEIINDIKAIDTTPKKVRDFGIVFFVVFAAIGGGLVYKGRMLGYGGFVLGLLFLFFGIWAPGTLKAPYKLWMGLAVVLGAFVSRFILCIIFYFVITPIGIIMRLIGKDLLNQNWDKRTPSYWIKKDSTPFDKERYKKLY